MLPQGMIGMKQNVKQSLIFSKCTLLAEQRGHVKVLSPLRRLRGWTPTEDRTVFNRQSGLFSDSRAELTCKAKEHLFECNRAIGQAERSSRSECREFANEVGGENSKKVERLWNDEIKPILFFSLLLTLLGMKHAIALAVSSLCRERLCRL